MNIVVDVRKVVDLENVVDVVRKAVVVKVALRVLVADFVVAVKVEVLRVDVLNLVLELKETVVLWTVVVVR